MYKGSVKLFLTNFVNDVDLSDEGIDELLKMLEKCKTSEQPREGGIMVLEVFFRTIAYTSFRVGYGPCSAVLEKRLLQQDSRFCLGDIVVSGCGKVFIANQN